MHDPNTSSNAIPKPAVKLESHSARWFNQKFHSTADRRSVSANRRMVLGGRRRDGSQVLQRAEPQPVWQLPVRGGGVSRQSWIVTFNLPARLQQVCRRNRKWAKIRIVS